MRYHKHNIASASNLNPRLPLRRAVAALANGGFTIVELLIVIVVIAILASLVLNNFGQAQQKAEVAKEVAMAKSYYKALFAAIQDGVSLSSYPQDACLGPPEFYPSGCSGWGQNNESVQPAFNALLKQYGAQDQQAGYFSGTNPVGTIMYGYRFYGHDAILYTLPGSETTCGFGHVLSDDGSGVKGYYGAPYSQRGSTTSCWMGLD